jgi:hypothetical protein
MKYQLLLCSFFAVSSVFADATIYVSPEGSDSADGAKSSPYASIEKAKTRVREMRKAGEKGEVKVFFADGVYKINKVINFEQEDSSSSGITTYAAVNPGKVKFDAGIDLPRLSPLKRSDPAYLRINESVRNKILTANLKENGITDYGILSAVSIGENDANGMELVFDGKLQTLARWPNEGYTGIKSVPAKKIVNGKKIPQESFDYIDDRISKWAEEQDPYANGFFCHNWAAARIAVKKIDTVTKTIFHKGKGSPYGYSNIGFWFGYNILCELDNPGEYYIDRTTGILYFYPPSGETVEKARLTFTRNILDFNNASNISFNGIVFENSRGYAIKAINSQNISITKCALRNIGHGAISMKNVQNVLIDGCDISYCNSGGVSVFAGDIKKLIHSNVIIRNNHIHHYAQASLTYCGAVSVTGCGLKILNNTIHDGPHGAIFFRGRENEIAYNEIHSVCLDSGEMGAIYTGRDWTFCGNMIVANYIHDIYNPRPQRNRAIMLDDGCAGITMISNVFVRVAEGISLSGIGNVIENNIFVENHPAVSCWQKWENHEDYTNTRYTHAQLLTILEELKPQEEPWKSKYPYLAMIDDAIKTGKMRDPATRTRICNNIICNSPSDWCRFMGERYSYSPQTWFLENNFLEDSSVFTNLAKGDYTIVKDAPLLSKGFKQIPSTSKMGVYKSENRFSWPVSHPVKIKCDSFTYKKQ